MITIRKNRGGLAVDCLAITSNPPAYYGVRSAADRVHQLMTKTPAAVLWSAAVYLPNRSLVVFPADMDTAAFIRDNPLKYCRVLDPMSAVHMYHALLPYLQLMASGE